MNSKLLLILIALLQSFVIQAQEVYKIKGTVQDAITGEVMPFANVFLAETTYGTSTDNRGEFTMNVRESGYYDLIVKFIGYGAYLQKVHLQKDRLLELDIFVKPIAKNLGSVVVSANDRALRKELEQRAKYLKIFKRGFFGLSRNGLRCELLNEEDLSFSFDKETNTLKATSDEPLIIENKLLGYKLHYYLDEFKADQNSGLTGYDGNAVFEEMETNNARTEKKWSNNRLAAYLGSETHFFSALFANNLNGVGYQAIIEDIEEVPNKETSERDSQDLSSYTVLDSINGLAKLDFNNKVYVEYESSLGLRKLERSTILIRKGNEPIVFEANGHVINRMSFLSEGHWGGERIGDMLPINYKPNF